MMNEDVQSGDISSTKAPKRPARHRYSNGRGRPKVKVLCNTDAEKSQLNEDGSITSLDDSSPVIQAFRQYQVSLDAKHDKYERLVKRSRDVTIESKRVIFLLHRITSDSEKNSVLEEAEEKLCQIRETSIRAIALELQNEDLYQFLRAISPGLQEYIEALTYFSYMKNENIATLLDVEKDFKFQNGEQTVTLSIPPGEYILGLADLSGELMRRGINSVAQGNMEVPFKLSLLLKSLFEGFNSLGMAGREISRKTRVLKQSLEKVERACYTINVRGSEIPKHMLTDVFSTEAGSPVREPRENY